MFAHAITLTKYIHTTAVSNILSYLYLDSRQAKSNHILINMIIIYRCQRPQLWLQQLLSKLSLFLYLKAAIFFSPTSKMTIIFGVIHPKYSYNNFFHHLFTPFPFYVLLTPDFPCSFALSQSWVLHFSRLFICTITPCLLLNKGQLPAAMYPYWKKLPVSG